MAGVKDRLVNVPVHESDVMNTVKLLPRTPQEAGIIPIKLKRKVEYKNTHKEEYVSVPKIKAALKTLKTLGHKYYQFLDELEIDDYESRCKDLENDELEFLFGNLDSEDNNKVFILPIKEKDNINFSATKQLQLIIKFEPMCY